MNLRKTFISFSLLATLLPSTMARGENSILGPGRLIDDNERLVLANPSWLTIRRYIENATRLPTEEATLRSNLKLNESDSFAPFKPLQKVFIKVKDDAIHWRDYTYPQALGLASDINTYSKKAAVFYEELIPVIDALVENPQDKDNKTLFRDIVIDLAETAKSHADNAENILDSIGHFQNQLSSDESHLAQLERDYGDKLGVSNENYRSLKADLDRATRDLEQENRRYDRQVMAAATSPSYAWVFPFGTIAATIVAGVYGDRAVETLRRIKRLKRQISHLSPRVERYQRFSENLDLAQGAVKNIKKDIESTLPIIRQVRGQWSYMSTDLNHISTIVNEELPEAVDHLKKLYIRLALNQWQEVGASTREFIETAYTLDNEFREI